MYPKKSLLRPPQKPTRDDFPTADKRDKRSKNRTAPRPSQNSRAGYRCVGRAPETATVLRRTSF